MFPGSFGFEGAKGDKGAKGVQGVAGAQVIISIVFLQCICDDLKNPVSNFVVKLADVPQWKTG